MATAWTCPASVSGLDLSARFRQTGWRISGGRGAARILGVKPTTLVPDEEAGYRAAPSRGRASILIRRREGLLDLAVPAITFLLLLAVGLDLTPVDLRGLRIGAGSWSAGCVLAVPGPGTARCIRAVAQPLLRSPPLRRRPRRLHCRVDPDPDWRPARRAAAPAVRRGTARLARPRSPERSPPSSDGDGDRRPGNAHGLPLSALQRERVLARLLYRFQGVSVGGGSLDVGWRMS